MHHLESLSRTPGFESNTSICVGACVLSTKGVVRGLVPPHWKVLQRKKSVCVVDGRLSSSPGLQGTIGLEDIL